MAMSAAEARELRAALAEALDPLYRARTGDLAPRAAVALAIERLHALDLALLCTMDQDTNETEKHP